MSDHEHWIDGKQWIVQFRNFFRDQTFYQPSNPLEMFVLLLSFEIAYRSDPMIGANTGNTKQEWWFGMEFVFDSYGDDE